MSLYRCAACGSPNVVIDTQANGVGYNYVKGAVGTAVLGVGGAAAGIESKQQTVYKCSDCGVALSYSMDGETKTVIEMGLHSEEIRSNLTLKGVHVEWSDLTAKYKNIEKGSVASLKSQYKEAILINKSKATKQEFDDAVDCIMDTLKKLGYFDNNEQYTLTNIPLQTYVSYKKSVSTFVENCFTYLPPSTNMFIEYRGLKLQNHILCLYCEYVLDKYFEYCEKCNEEPILIYDFYLPNKEFKSFVDRNPFIKEFAEKYNFKDYFIGLFDTTGRWRWSFDSDLQEHTHRYFHTLSYNIMGCVVPRYKIENDTLWYCNSELFLGTDSLYYKKNPEKKAEVEANVEPMIDSIRQQISKLSNTIIDSKNRLKELPNKIEEAERRLCIAQRKLNSFFGKKKAASDCEHLKKEIDNLNKEATRHKDSISNNEKAMQDLHEKEIAIFKEYNYCLAWERVEQL